MPVVAEPVAAELAADSLAVEAVGREEMSQFAAESVPAARNTPVPRRLARRGTAANPGRRDFSVIESPGQRGFTTFWEFAIAVNRSDPAALVLAGNGAASDIPIDGVELRKLLGMMWFRTVLGRLSEHWRQRVLDVLVESAELPDHALKVGRQTMHLREMSYEQLQELGAKTMVPDWIRPDLDLLITVGRFWGPDTLKRFRFVDPPGRREPSMMSSLLDRLRGDL
jgi:hypothetical protein